MPPNAPSSHRTFGSTISGGTFAVALAGIVASGCGGSNTPDDSTTDAQVGNLPDAGIPGPKPVKFIVMGDTGEGNTAQKDVAAQIKNKCDAEGCDFVLLLGDNIYDSGVTSVTDPQWQTKFEEPYAAIDLPFYAVLGNHDYGGKLLGQDLGGLGNEWDKGPIEVQYTDVSTKWFMPASHYTLRYENVGFVMLDTNSIMWDDTTYGDQRAWYPAALTEIAGSEWTIVVGHHPHRSNGAHGNAGTYESIEVAGTEIPIPVPILDGKFMKSYFEQVVCGTADVVFSGHDHNRQWLDEPTALCGAELFVTGAGAKLTALKDRGNKVFYQDDTAEGFLYVRIEGNQFFGQYIDKTGTVNYERSFTR